MKHWWKNTIVYELYTQSFYDTNGDGIGDIQGIIEKLDYLKDLGVGAIWLTPIYKSPLVDNGYDISDYKDINPIYGSLELFKTLIKEAEAKNIKIIMDLVLNHTSDQHEWFIESRKSKTNKFRDYYVWRDKPDDQKSIFGGPAWTFDDETKQYYYHLFAKEQPDLNWENPKVRSEISKMIKWWVDLGVGGFRLDVIDFIGKEVDKKIVSNGPNLHKFIKELRAESWADSTYLTVGECWGATIEDGIKFSNEDRNEFSMIFQFEQVTELQHELGRYKFKENDFIKFKKVYTKWQQGMYNVGWNSLFLGNHDLPRMISKYGNDKEYRIESAKTLFTTMFLMQGTPFIYQGDEFGMVNTNWDDLKKYPDIEIINHYKDLVINEKKITHDEFLEGVMKNGRDHSRTPMQWSSEKLAGFSTSKPWIGINENYKTINFESDKANPNGIYNFLKKLIKFRNESEFSEIIREGEYIEELINDKELFIYHRSYKNKLIKIIANWSESKIDLKSKGINIDTQKIVLNTSANSSSILEPWQTIVTFSD